MSDGDRTTESRTFTEDSGVKVKRRSLQPEFEFGHFLRLPNIVD